MTLYDDFEVQKKADGVQVRRNCVPAPPLVEPETPKVSFKEGEDLAAIAATSPVAVRANEGKTPMWLLPPELVKLAAPAWSHAFVDWFFKLTHDTASPLLVDAVNDAFKACGEGDFARGILRVAEIYKKGAAKYAPRNWEKGLPFSNLYDSGMRHALKSQFEERDSDSGQRHVEHFAWNVAACLVFYARERAELDDRDAAIAGTLKVA